MVFDPRDWSWELTDKNPSLKPHSGKKYLASFYNYTEEAGSVEFYDSNDWLVSPTLSGEAQTISFWVNNVKAGDSDNVEKFELLYSVAGNDTTEFVKLGDTYTVSGGEWQQITASLPAGATHFAIRHCTDSKHSFVFMVDDVCYVGGSGVLKGYNVYRDQTLVATLEPTQTTFTDSKVPMAHTPMPSRHSMPRASLLPHSRSVSLRPSALSPWRTENRSTLIRSMASWWAATSLR